MCSGPYHYKTSCEGVHELKRKYDYWKNEQRLPFMQQYRQDQSSNAEQLDEYNKRKLQLEKDQRVADAMKKAEEADELYKSQHCVSCPKCKRVIQHMGGCDGKLFFSEGRMTKRGVFYVVCLIYHSDCFFFLFRLVFEAEFLFLDFSLTTCFFCFFCFFFVYRYDMWSKLAWW